MSITGQSTSRKRLRKPSWKMEQMSGKAGESRRTEKMKATHLLGRARKSRRTEKRSHPDTWALHDLGESDDEQPYPTSRTRSRILVSLRIRAPVELSEQKYISDVSHEARPIPVRIRLRAFSLLEPRRDNSIVARIPEQNRSLPVRLRLKDPSALRRKSAGRYASNLPRDVLLKIFSHLQAVPDLCMIAQVCTAWAEVATVPELWHSVKATDIVTRRMKDEESKANYQHICYDSPMRETPITKHRRKAKKLRGVRQAVEVITRRGGNRLVSLDLEDCFPLHYKDAFQMTNTELEKIAVRSADSLEELRISPSPQISGIALVAFAKSCAKLKVLHMSGCKTLSSSQFGEIVRSCPSLEDISVSQCPGFRGSRLDERLHPVRSTLRRLDISDTLTTRFPMTKFATEYPVLEDIKADNCEYMHILDRPPTHNVIQQAMFPSLVSFNIDKISHLPLPWLAAICRTCPTLQMLTANKIQQPQLLIGSLFEGALPPLQHLSLSGQPVDNEAWQYIFSKLRTSLVQCDLSRNISLTCSLYAEDGQTFQALEELNVSSTGATDAAILEVMRLSPKLTFLDITGCRSVENRDFRRNPLLFRFS